MWRMRNFYKQESRNSRRLYIAITIKREVITFISILVAYDFIGLLFVAFNMVFFNWFNRDVNTPPDFYVFFLQSFNN